MLTQLSMKSFLLMKKKVKRKVQGVPQSQSTALPRPQGKLKLLPTANCFLLNIAKNENFSANNLKMTTVVMDTCKGAWTFVNYSL